MISPERKRSSGGDVPACDRAAIIGQGEADDWDRWARRGRWSRMRERC